MAVNFCRKIDSPNRRKWHLRGSSFRNFPGEHTPGPPELTRGSAARGRRTPKYDTVRFQAGSAPGHGYIKSCMISILSRSCGLVYILGLFAGYGPALPLCLVKYREDGKIAYENYFNGYIMFCFCLFPTIFMALVYFKIGRALMKQNKYIQNICSNAAGRQRARSSSFNILAYFRNRKTFFVCLLTVLCYPVGNILMTVWIILWIATDYRLLRQYCWFGYCAHIVSLASSHSPNEEDEVTEQ